MLVTKFHWHGIKVSHFVFVFEYCRFTTEWPVYFNIGDSKDSKSKSVWIFICSPYILTVICAVGDNQLGAVQSKELCSKLLGYCLDVQ